MQQKRAVAADQKEWPVLFQPESETLIRVKGANKARIQNQGSSQPVPRWFDGVIDFVSPDGWSKNSRP